MARSDPAAGGGRTTAAMPVTGAPADRPAMRASVVAMRAVVLIVARAIGVVVTTVARTIAVAPDVPACVRVVFVTTIGAVVTNDRALNGRVVPRGVAVRPVVGPLRIVLRAKGIHVAPQRVAPVVRTQAATPRAAASARRVSVAEARQVRGRIAGARIGLIRVCRARGSGVASRSTPRAK
ncbi:hypothetical protein ACWF82_05050 [Nocardia sp. NPDC055053]